MYASKRIKAPDLRILKITTLATLFFGLFAHAFAYLNLEYNHDSLMVVTSDQNWQISLGRYLQPLWIGIRGKINAPWFIGILSLLFLALSLALIFNLFQFKNKFLIISLCGIISTNVSLICANATYITWADIYMLALLFATFAIWIINDGRLGLILGGLALTASLALYQSFLTVYILIAMLYSLKNLILTQNFHNTLKYIIRTILGAIIGGTFYLIGLIITTDVFSVPLADNGFNSLKRIKKVEGISAWIYLKKTYSYFLDFFYKNSAWNNRLEIIINIFLFVLSIFLIIQILCLTRYKFWEPVKESL
jgi:hypothetical protein